MDMEVAIRLRGRQDSPAVDGQLELSGEVAEGIQRCAEVLSDLPRLRDELHGLRVLSDPHAQFATALFDLERARRGDPEARGNMLELADQLLVFWRAGSGIELARSHPVLEDLWETAASLLASFETKRFGKALKACWDVRSEPVLLQVAIRDLQPEGNRRVEFSRCLYHLELARQFVDSSRAEFAKRAGLLAEAYQSQEVADLLVGDDPGLKVLWVEVEPYLDEFFEMLEQDATRRSKAAEAAAVSEAVTAPGRDAVKRPDVKSDPAARAAAAATPAAGSSSASDTLDPDVVFEQEEEPPPFEEVDLMGLTPGTSARAVPTFDALMGAPPAPPDLTPPGSWFPPAGEVGSAGFAVPPPPPKPSIPTPLATQIVTDVDLDLVEVDEAPPIRRSYNLDVSIEEDDPDAKSLAFWKHSISQLSLLPDPSTPRLAKRLLNADSRAERKTLTNYLDGLTPWLEVDDAKAFAALIKLMLAGQLKEKSLFGQVNTRRAEAFVDAFGLLGSPPRSAGHAAVWFVMDGPETVSALQRGLDVMMRYLAFCSRQNKDPLDLAAQKSFVSQVNP